MQRELVCAWCNKKKKNVQLVTEGKSHGICPACVKRVFGFSVQQMYQASYTREQDIKIAKIKKRKARRASKSWRSACVR